MGQCSFNWQYTFNGLPKLINGKQVIYTLSETPVEGYETKERLQIGATIGTHVGPGVFGIIFIQK